MNDSGTLPSILTRFQQRSLLVGIAALAASAGALYVGDSTEFYKAYLIGFFLVLGLTLGAMGLLFVHHLVGGAWGFIVQRMLEAATRTIPLVAILFLPLVYHVFTDAHPIYHWAEAGAAAHDALLQHKAPYLNVEGFAIRAGVYFVVWFVLIFLLNSISRRQDETGDGRLSNRLGQISGPGIVLYMFTMTFASFDWAMSLDPHWFSTIYGVIFVVGQVLSSMAMMVVMVPLARRNTDLGLAITPERFHDLTKLMFAFTCLWAYVQLSQFLIIWYGNLPEEVIFFHLRSHGGYEYFAIALVLGQFVFPFLILLSRWPKRSMKWAPRIAAWVLFVRYIDLYWYLMPHPEPGTHEAHLHFHWVHVTAPVGLLGIWFFAFLWNLSKRPMLPVNDPRWKEKLSHVH
ncbi:MAG: hypothetical protein KTR25_16870 [Myxococcales bacterium]|nr:hypothetical protein [Myxococcales bacterium]